MRLGLRKNVTVHRCFNPQTEKCPPLDCGCKKFVSHKDADDMVGSGEYAFVMQAFKNSELPDHSRIVALGRKPFKRIERAAMVNKGNIERAYASGMASERRAQEERERIELFNPKIWTHELITAV